MKLRRRNKILIIGIAGVLLLCALVIVFISPITKYVVEKYDVKWTGREVTMDWAYVNPFTCYVYFSNFKIYEEKSDSVALSANSISAQFGLRKILSKNYEINELILDHPRWVVVKDTAHYNFTSFIRSFTSDVKDSLESASNFNILDLRYNKGEIHYHQKDIPVDYFIKNATIETTGKLIDADSVGFNFYFESGPGSGSMEGNFTVNFLSQDYHYNVVIKKFDLTQVEQYMRPFLDYGTFRAYLNADANATGNFKSADAVKLHGRVEINDLHFGKNPKEDYISFDTLTFAINEVSPANKIYRFDSVSLIHPYFKYDVYDSLDNIQTMLSNSVPVVSLDDPHPAKFNLIIAIGHYIKGLARDFFESYYKVTRFEIKRADIKYNDYGLSERFYVGLNPLNIVADSIDNKRERVNFYFKSGIVPFGDFAIHLSVNPRDTGEFDMNYRFENMPATLFNPYLITYTSFPLDRGTISFNGEWNVRRSRLKSTNHVVILDPRVTKRLRKKDTKWIPMPLIMAVARERGNVIDYEIPITGHFRHPHFHLHDVLMDALKNIFVKPPTTPYRLQVKNTEREIEKSLALKWLTRRTFFQSYEEDFAMKIAGFLADNPAASIHVYPQVYVSREKEYITFFEAKKKYFLLSSDKKDEQLTEEDSEKVEKMSIRDTSFMRYMHRHSNDSLLFAIQDKCAKFIGTAVVNAKYKQLNALREKAFLAYFKDEGVQKRVTIHPSEETVPYNGYSYYKIAYKGDMPEDLREAYDKMNELNETGPRKRFEQQRKKDKAPVYDVKAKQKKL